MPGAPWAVTKLRNYREHQGRPQRRCKVCKGWFELEQLAKQADCRFGRLPMCLGCKSDRCDVSRRGRRESKAERVLKKLGISRASSASARPPPPSPRNRALSGG